MVQEYKRLQELNDRLMEENQKLARLNIEDWLELQEKRALLLMLLVSYTPQKEFGVNKSVSVSLNVHEKSRGCLFQIREQMTKLQGFHFDAWNSQSLALSMARWTVEVRLKYFMMKDESSPEEFKSHWSSEKFG